MQQAMKRARKKEGEIEDEDEVCGHYSVSSPNLLFAGGTSLPTH